MEVFATSFQILLIGIASAVAGLTLLRLYAGGIELKCDRCPPDSEDSIVYLFEGSSLIDATERARSMMCGGHHFADEWSQFIASFSPRFPRIEDRLKALAPGQSLGLSESENAADGMHLQAELHNGILRVTFTDPDDEKCSERFERHALHAMETELEMLRAVAEDSPILTWKQQEDGTVVWANRAYMSEVQREFGEAAVTAWPPRQLFPALQTTEQLLLEGPRRISRPSARNETRSWYDLNCYNADTSVLCFATPIDQLMQAEASLKDFIATLGKTFAQLPIGLAIFDNKRRLVLFNPALIDLTSLGAEVLTQRPTLHAFLDALRENQRIPEPRDYKSWRLRIAQLEAAAEDGRYKETWTLPTGQTYRVTGQPHPDGAVAFLFEDISSEVSLKRRFRSEIDLGLSVLSAFENALAVFDNEGTLLLSNASYGALWNIAPETSLSRITLIDALREWGVEAEGDALPLEIRNFVMGEGPRYSFSFSFKTADGTMLYGNIRALKQRASLIEFHRAGRHPNLPLPAEEGTQTDEAEGIAVQIAAAS